MNTVERPNSNLELAITAAQGVAVSNQKVSIQKVSAIEKSGGNVAQASGKALQSDITKPSNIDLDQLQKSVESINQFISNYQRSINFSVENDLNKTVIKVVNTETDEVIRQIPSEEAIALAKAIEDTLSNTVDNVSTAEQGLIFAKQA